MAVPPQARGTFAVALPCMIAAPALSGFYLSLGPSLAAQVLGSRDLVWGGLVIWVVYYLAFSAPVLIAGAAITHFGLHQTAVVYSAALAGRGR